MAAINAGTQASSSTLRTAVNLARHPLSAAGYLRDGAGVAGELGYLLLMNSDSQTRFKGKPMGSKRVAWSEPLKRPEVKAVSRALGCSINDMLLSCVAGSLRSYLAEAGDKTEGVEVRALVPIDLREPGDVELGNRFGIIVVELPVGIEHPLERLMTVRQRMIALKTSYEPATTLGLFAALGYLPPRIALDFASQTKDEGAQGLASGKALARAARLPGRPPDQVIAAGGWDRWGDEVARVSPSSAAPRETLR